MPRARNTLVSLDATPYYHCVSRCVCHAFLCGNDPLSGQSYEHRRGWIEDKILFLAQVFAIDVAAYAVMHNHYHVLLHVDKSQAELWSVREVIEHWHRLFKGHVLLQRYIQGESLTRAELNALDELVIEWRTRLSDISWFMVALTRPVFHDTCTSMYIAITKRRTSPRSQQGRRLYRALPGRSPAHPCAHGTCASLHIGGRFKSQAILDEPALAACMAYIDLNPIRAGLAKTPARRHAKGITLLFNRLY